MKLPHYYIFLFLFVCESSTQWLSRPQFLGPVRASRRRNNNLSRIKGIPHPPFHSVNGTSGGDDSRQSSAVTAPDYGNEYDGSADSSSFTTAPTLAESTTDYNTVFNDRMLELLKKLGDVKEPTEAATTTTTTEPPPPLIGKDDESLEEKAPSSNQTEIPRSPFGPLSYKGRGPRPRQRQHSRGHPNLWNNIRGIFGRNGNVKRPTVLPPLPHKQHSIRRFDENLPDLTEEVKQDSSAAAPKPAKKEGKAAKVVESAPVKLPDRGRTLLDTTEEDSQPQAEERSYDESPQTNANTLSTLAKLSPKKAIMVFMLKEGILETEWAGVDPGKVVKKYAGSTKIQFFNGTLPEENLPAVFLAPEDTIPPVGYGKIPIPKIGKKNDVKLPKPKPTYYSIEEQLRLLRLHREKLRLQKLRQELNFGSPYESAYNIPGQSGYKVLTMDPYGAGSSDLYDQIKSTLPEGAVVESIEPWKKPQNHYGQYTSESLGAYKVIPSPKAPNSLKPSSLQPTKSPHKSPSSAERRPPTTADTNAFKSLESAGYYPEETTKRPLSHLKPPPRRPPVPPRGPVPPPPLPTEGQKLADDILPPALTPLVSSSHGVEIELPAGAGNGLISNDELQKIVGALIGSETKLVTTTPTPPVHHRDPYQADAYGMAPPEEKYPPTSSTPPPYRNPQDRYPPQRKPPQYSDRPPAQQHQGPSNHFSPPDPYSSGKPSNHGGPQNQHSDPYSPKPSNHDGPSSQYDPYSGKPQGPPSGQFSPPEPYGGKPNGGPPSNHMSPPDSYKSGPPHPRGPPPPPRRPSPPRPPQYPPPPGGPHRPSPQQHGPLPPPESSSEHYQPTTQSPHGQYGQQQSESQASYSAQQHNPEHSQDGGSQSSHQQQWHQQSHDSKLAQAEFEKPFPPPKHPEDDGVSMGFNFFYKTDGPTRLPSVATKVANLFGLNRQKPTPPSGPHPRPPKPAGGYASNEVHHHHGPKPSYGPGSGYRSKEVHTKPSGYGSKEVSSSYGSSNQGQYSPSSTPPPPPPPPPPPSQYIPKPPPPQPYPPQSNNKPKPNSFSAPPYNTPGYPGVGYSPSRDKPSPPPPYRPQGPPKTSNSDDPSHPQLSAQSGPPYTNEGYRTIAEKPNQYILPGKHSSPSSHENPKINANIYSYESGNPYTPVNVVEKAKPAALPTGLKTISDRATETETEEIAGAASNLRTTANRLPHPDNQKHLSHEEQQSVEYPGAGYGERDKPRTKSPTTIIFQKSNGKKKSPTVIITGDVTGDMSNVEKIIDSLNKGSNTAEDYYSTSTESQKYVPSKEQSNGGSSFKIVPARGVLASSTLVEPEPLAGLLQQQNQPQARPTTETSFGSMYEQFARLYHGQQLQQQHQQQQQAPQVILQQGHQQQQQQQPVSQAASPQVILQQNQQAAAAAQQVILQHNAQQQAYPQYIFQQTAQQQAAPQVILQQPAQQQAAPQVILQQSPHQQPQVIYQQAPQVLSHQPYVIQQGQLPQQQQQQQQFIIQHASYPQDQQQQLILQSQPLVPEPPKPEKPKQPAPIIVPDASPENPLPPVIFVPNPPSMESPTPTPTNPALYNPAPATEPPQVIYMTPQQQQQQLYYAAAPSSGQLVFATPTPSGQQVYYSTTPSSHHIAYASTPAPPSASSQILYASPSPSTSVLYSSGGQSPQLIYAPQPTQQGSKASSSVDEEILGVHRDAVEKAKLAASASHLHSPPQSHILYDLPTATPSSQSESAHTGSSSVSASPLVRVSSGGEGTDPRVEMSMQEFSSVIPVGHGEQDRVLEKVKTEEKIVWKDMEIPGEYVTRLTPVRVTTQEKRYKYPGGKSQVETSVLGEEIAHDLLGHQPVDTTQFLKRSGTVVGGSGDSGFGRSKGNINSPVGGRQDNPSSLSAHAGGGGGGPQESAFTDLLKTKAAMEKMQQELHPKNHLLHHDDKSNFMSTVFGKKKK